MEVIAGGLRPNHLLGLCQHLGAEQRSRDYHLKHESGNRNYRKIYRCVSAPFGLLGSWTNLLLCCAAQKGDKSSSMFCWIHHTSHPSWFSHPFFFILLSKESLWTIWLWTVSDLVSYLISGYSKIDTSQNQWPSRVECRYDRVNSFGNENIWKDVKG